MVEFNSTRGFMFVSLLSDIELQFIHISRPQVTAVHFDLKKNPVSEQAS